jgi:glycosyltransferase involved in cell wall biosynthesis
MRILFLEPFFGGSHKDFAKGLIEHSRHDFDLLTLPARFWKWRIRGAALHFYKQIEKPAKYDLILATDLMSIADLKALLGPAAPPVLLYFHENQLSYPLPEGKSMDYHFGFTDITSALAADCVVFNSHFHKNAFFSSLPRFLSRMPEYRPQWIAESIRAKSSVLYPGCRFPARGESPGRPVSDKTDHESTSPIIMWNHRWEFDKNPDQFFDLLRGLKEQQVPFRLALLGESYKKKPASFLKVKEEFADELLQYGYIENKDEYMRLLTKGSIVISTAIQENFGISVLEAVYCGCLPLLPRRLVYPELIPAEYHDRVLYDSPADLIRKCSRMVQLFGKAGENDGYESRRAASQLRTIRRDLMHWASRYSWELQINDYDQFFEQW